MFVTPGSTPPYFTIISFLLHCTKLQYNMLHLTIPSSISFIFVSTTTATALAHEGVCNLYLPQLLYCSTLSVLSYFALCSSSFSLQQALTHPTASHHTLSISFIFACDTAAPGSRGRSLHHLTSECNYDVLAMLYLVSLYLTTLCCTTVKQVLTSVLGYYCYF